MAAVQARCAAWFIGIALCLAAGQAPAVQRYLAVPLGTLGGDYSQANAINDRGEVAGTSKLPSGPALHAFLHDGTQMRDLGTLGAGESSDGSGINALGHVTGSSGDGLSSMRAFVFANGVMTPRDIFPGRRVQAVAINASGQIAGSVALPGPSRPFLYSSGQAVVLGTSEGYGYGLNSSGDVVGTSDVPVPGGVAKHAFLFTKGAMKDLGTLGGISSLAFAVNDSGWVTGAADRASGGYGAFIYSGGFMRDLGDLGGGASAGNGINAKGEVVGEALIPPPQDEPWRAFLYTDGTMYDLNRLVIGGLDGAVLNSARAINERGQIVAQGCKAGACSAYRLDPVGDPSAVPALSPFALFASATLVFAIAWPSLRPRV